MKSVVCKETRTTSTDCTVVLPVCVGVENMDFNGTGFGPAHPNLCMMIH